MEQKLTSAIAGAYFGAMVRTPDGDYKMHHVAPNLMYVEIGEGNQFDYVRYEHCQLILTPLSKISDEHAVELSKIASPLYPDYDNGWHLIVGRYIAKHKNHPRAILYAENFREMFDYLRSKEYDCGYGSIPSLISAGIAVEK